MPAQVRTETQRVKSPTLAILPTPSLSIFSMVCSAARWLGGHSGDLRCTFKLPVSSFPLSLGWDFWYKIPKAFPKRFWCMHCLLGIPLCLCFSAGSRCFTVTFRNGFLVVLERS